MIHVNNFNMLLEIFIFIKYLIIKITNNERNRHHCLVNVIIS